MDINRNNNNKKTTVPTNKTELILYRLDAIDQKLVDLQVLMTQTALQEKRIADLEAVVKTYQQKETDFALLQSEVKELREQKKSHEAKWWQIVLIILSPIISAVVIFVLMGGLANAK